MLKKSSYVLAICLFTLSSCKDEVKQTEVEQRKEISTELENAGLQKKSHHDDAVIAAMNVIYKTPYTSLKDDNKEVLERWNKAIDYNGPQDLYDDLFSSFNMSEQVASLIGEYSSKEFTSVHERDVFNQSVSLLFLKENNEKALQTSLNTFKEVYNLASKDMQAAGSDVNVNTWNKGMTKNFSEYWYVHLSRILEASKVLDTNIYLKSRNDSTLFSIKIP